MENETKVRHWREFAVSPPASRSGLYASINPEGRIAFNRLAWEQLGGPKVVSMLYDETNLCIGIRAVSPVMPNAFPVVAINRERTRFWIRAHDFIKQAGIDISYCIRFLDPHLEDDTLVLDLNHATRVIGSRNRSG